MKKRKLKSNNKSLLFNRGSKKFMASVLSDEKKHLVITKKDLNNIENTLDKELITFYQSKITKARTKKEPKDYSPKKYRKFTDASPLRKNALKKLNSYLNELPLPHYLYSRSEQGFLKNAKAHYGNTSFVLMDINSFFPNCNFLYVKDFFIRDSGLKMKPDLADRMAKFVTVPKSNKSKERVVPQGFPTSPLICYFAYKAMFDEINIYAKERNLTFSTYVDDIALSSKEEFDKEQTVNDIIQILEKYGHSSKREKCKIIDTTNPACFPPTITGIWVKRYKIRASKKIYDKMMVSYNNLISNPIVDEISYIKSWKWFVKLNGILQTIKYIEPQTEYKREYIIKYVKNNKNNFTTLLSPNDNIFKSRKWQKKIYLAYQSKTLSEFVKSLLVKREKATK